jgi:uncharacterized protein YidB (DUF937 family)
MQPCGAANIHSTEDYSMGLLDGLLNALNDPASIGELLRDNPQVAEAAKSFLGNDSAVGPSGGLNDILDQLQSSGLGDTVASWLGSGENKAVSADQLQDALGERGLNQFAQHAGIDLRQAAGVLAGMLPQVVDQLSPQGSVPEGSGLDDLLGAFLGRRG